jgi:hypothetical protein
VREKEWVFVAVLVAAAVLLVVLLFMGDLDGEGLF